MKLPNTLSKNFIIKINLVLFLSVCIGFDSAVAQTGEVISSAIPSDATPGIGEQITVTINIDMTGVDSPDEKLGSYSGTFEWDNTILDYVSNSGIPAGFTGIINTSDASSGTITFNGANASGETGDITILEITFDVIGSGTSVLDLDYSAMAAATTYTNLLSILTINDGQIDVSPGPGITVSPISGLTTTEIGGTATFDISANTAPLSNVTVPLSSSDMGEGTVPASVVLPAGSTEAVSVTVTGVDDDIADGDISYNIVTGDPTSADAAYNAPGAGDVSDVSVTNSDNEEPNLVISSAITSDATPFVGDKITVTVNVDLTGVNPPDENLGNFTGSLEWDFTVLDYVSNSGVTSGLTGSVNTFNTASGEITFNGNNAAGTSVKFDIITVTFDVVGSGTSVLDLGFSSLTSATTQTNLLQFLTINDGSVFVTDTNKRPVANAGTDIEINEDEYVSLDGTGSFDLDINDNITYSWLSPDGITLNDNTSATLGFTAFSVEKDETLMFVLTVNDGNISSVPDTVYVTVKQVNQPPVFVSEEVKTAEAGYKYVYNIVVNDPDILDTVTITAQGLPDWLNITDNGDRTATLEGTPPEIENILGEYRVSILATDGNIAEPVKQEFTIILDWKTFLDLMEFFDVVVYPNPTHDFVNIHINKIPWTETTIKVLNQIGQVVIMKTIDSQNEMINLSGYASGLYLILITENNSNYCKQFIINKQ